MVSINRDGVQIWCAPVDVLHVDCIYRSCFHPHDCGHNKKVYVKGLWTSNKWIRRGVCVTRHNNGCPVEFKVVVCCDKANFSLKGHPNSRRCRACGRRVPVRVIKLWRKQLGTGRPTQMEVTR